MPVGSLDSPILASFEVLRNQRAEYGKQIVAPLARQLWWSHFVEVMPLKISPILMS